MLGRPRPITFTCLALPALVTASAAAGTAGEQMAMISFTFGCEPRIVVAREKASLSLSLHACVSTSVMFGYFSFRRASIVFCQAIMFDAASDAVMVADLPLSP